MTTEYVVPLRQLPTAPVRLLLFHYAGAAASVFRPWMDWLPPDIDVAAFELPGRVPGRDGLLLRSVHDVVDRAASQVGALMHLPTVVFGHSIGALIAFEMIRALQRAADPLPQHFIVSARRAPQLPPPERLMHLLPDREFIERLKSYDGTPEPILRDDALMALFLPRLRADFAISETYRYGDGPLLSCPVTALAGDQDVEAPMESVFQWRYQAAGTFRFVRMKGGHFFLHEQKDELASVLREAIDSVRNAAAPARSAQGLVS